MMVRDIEIGEYFSYIDTEYNEKEVCLRIGIAGNSSFVVTIAGYPIPQESVLGVNSRGTLCYFKPTKEVAFYAKT